MSAVLCRPALPSASAALNSARRPCSTSLKRSSAPSKQPGRPIPNRLNRPGRRRAGCNGPGIVDELYAQAKKPENRGYADNGIEAFKKRPRAT